MLDMEGWYMIRDLRKSGMPISAIAREMGITRNTVKKHLREKNPSSYARKKRPSILDPYRDYITQQIEKYDLSAIRIYEEMRKKGYRGSYTRVKDYCRSQRKYRSISAVYRYETEPGRQAQVDFGDFGHIEMDGKRARLYLFSYILSNSRYSYIEFTVDISTEALIRMHINAFRYTGGIPSEILFDNMKQIVLERRLKASESRFNPEFQQFSQYYAFNVRLCYPYRPQTKGKVKQESRCLGIETEKDGQKTIRTQKNRTSVRKILESSGYILYRVAEEYGFVDRYSLAINDLTRISNPAGKFVILAAECITGPEHSIHLHTGIPELKEKEICDLIDLVGSNDPDIIAILEKSMAKYIMDEFGSSGIVYDLSAIRYYDSSNDLARFGEIWPLLPHERGEQGDQLGPRRHTETRNSSTSQANGRKHSFRVNHLHIRKGAEGLWNPGDPHRHGQGLPQR